MSTIASDKRGRARGGIFVALLRGVNVGGNNIVSMASLKASFEGLGFEDVASYINSGNIIFRAKEGRARKLEQRIEGMLSAEYQLACRVVVRSLSEMAALIESIPDTWTGDTHWRYNVIFLRHSIDSPDIVDGLKPRDGIEEVAYRPGTLLWSAQVKHVTRTAMVKLPGHRNYREMTVRNLNTTRKLYGLMTTIARRVSR